MRDEQYIRTKGGKRQPRNLKSKWSGRLASFMEAAALRKKAKPVEEIMAEFLRGKDMPAPDLIAEIRALLENK